MSYIEFRNISKVYGDCVSCSEISLFVKKATIHSIIGENGAGKSTLVKVLGGVVPAYEGQLFIGGKDYSPKSAQDAFSHRIAFIHQHFVLAENLTALDNLVLSATSGRNPFALKNSAQVAESANQLLKRFSWTIQVGKLVRELSVGEQQRLEILKALMQEPDIIIFDEPTAVLTPQESEELMKFLLQLKAEGKTIILISHKLNEVSSVSDEISILRHGRLVSTHQRHDLQIAELAELMIGRKIVKSNSVERTGPEKLLFKIPDTDIELKKSEIFGVAGIEGNGQSEFIAVLLNQFKKNRLSFGDITEDRIKLSLFEELNLFEHMLLKHKEKFTSFGVLNENLLAEATLDLVKHWDVRPPEIHKPLSEFSGGNQQKFMVGREMWNEPDVLLAAHPSRGVDLGAQEMIHSALLNYSKNEKAVILVSSDLDEILFLADRYIILSKGKIHGPFKKSQLAEKEIGLFMAGQS